MVKFEGVVLLSDWSFAFLAAHHYQCTTPIIPAGLLTNTFTGEQEISLSMADIVPVSGLVWWGSLPVCWMESGGSLSMPGIKLIRGL